MLRHTLLALLLVGATTARFRGSNAFVVEDMEEYDQDGEVVTLSPTLPPQEEVRPVEAVVTESTTAPTAVSTSSKMPSLIGLAEDGHDPMEVVEAAIDILNTPVNRMVGSNPLRRLLRLVGPTKDDFMHSIQLTQDVQKATGQTTLPPVTDLPSVVNNLFGFQESDDDLFHRTTTLAPLFPVMAYDHDAVYKYLNKFMTESAAKTTGAPIPKL